MLLEFACFLFLYAAVYGNFATLVGWHGYGRSVVMVLDVAISLPVVEYLVVSAPLRLEPALSKGSVEEWIVLAVHFAMPALLLGLCWRGRMRGRLSWRGDWPVLAILVGAPVVHLAFALASGFFEVLWLVAAWTVRPRAAPQAGRKPVAKRRPTRR